MRDRGAQHVLYWTSTILHNEKHVFLTSRCCYLYFPNITFVFSVILRITNVLVPVRWFISPNPHKQICFTQQLNEKHPVESTSMREWEQKTALATWFKLIKWTLIPPRHCLIASYIFSVKSCNLHVQYFLIPSINQIYTATLFNWYCKQKAYLKTYAAIIKMLLCWLCLSLRKL